MAKPNRVVTQVHNTESPETRLQRLEAEIAKLKAPPILWLEILKALSPLLAGVAVAWVGYGLTGSLNNALQRKHYELSNVKEMRDILLKLGSSETTLEESMASVRTLSAFGTAAITPLISLLESGGDTKIPAAQEGLRAVALSDVAEVCRQLTNIANNRTRLFTWETHRWTIQLLGELNCQESKEPLEAYQGLLKKSSGDPAFAPYSMTVRSTPAVTNRSLVQLKREVGTSLELLHASIAMAAPE